MKLVAHLDADCYYCSAERVRHPQLESVPVGVVGNNGACVIAKSYEMKSCGVKTGEAIWDAVQKCPNGIYVKRDFEWYEVISHRILETLRRVSPHVEYYSVDEWFFDADCLANGSGQSLEDAARELQHHIRESIGVPVSIGISTTRTLAKLGSDSSKPYGVRVLLEDVSEFLSGQPVWEVSGIGKRSAMKLARLGAENCQQFARLPRSAVRKALTVVGERLWLELHGVKANPVLQSRPQHRFVSRGGSVGRKVSHYEHAEAWAVRNLERLIETLDRHMYWSGTLSLELEYLNCPKWSRRMTLPEETASSRYLLPMTLEMLRSGWRTTHPLTHMHVIAGKIGDRTRRQLSLFPFEDARPVDEIKRTVNEKIGRFALRSGSTLRLPDLYEDDAHSYEICDIDGKTCF